MARIEEMGVVAEASTASWLVDYNTMPLAFDDQGLRIAGTANEHEDAHVVRRAIRICRRHLGQIRDQLRVIARIRFWLTRVSRRDHARRAVERVDADARIVGERRQS